MDQRMDAMLMEILHERKTVTGFLDSVFGFLRRNTDFYYLQTEGENVGFRKGVREQLLIEAMQRYDPKYNLNQLIASAMDDKCAPPAVEEVEIESMTVDTNQSVQNDIVNSKLADFMPSDHKNGSIFETYCWSQTLKDVELHINLPKDLAGARQLLIEIMPQSITVRSRQERNFIIFSDTVYNKYKHNDVVWTISEGKLHISLDKCKEVWWDKLFVSEKCIDPKMVECERYVDELPEESQVAIQKLRTQHMQPDQQVQALNEADSEIVEKLRMAWNSEDSPFRGQPFDPLIKFS